MADTEHPIESRFSGEQDPIPKDDAVWKHNERTFMGGIGLGTRASLFVLLGLVILASGGFGLYQADQYVNRMEDKTASAASFVRSIDAIEKRVLRIRAEGTEIRQSFPERNSGIGQKEREELSAEIDKAVEQHLGSVITLGQSLDVVSQSAIALPIRDNITTLSEAVAQYVEAFGNAASASERKSQIDLTGLEVELRKSARNLETLLSGINVLSLRESFDAIRVLENAFVENGITKDLAIVTQRLDELLRLLTSVPLEDNDKVLLEKLITAYQGHLTNYAKARLLNGEDNKRLDEIVSYMAPNVEGMASFASGNLQSQAATEAAFKEKVKLLIASIGAALLLLLLLVGLMILKSVTGPAKASAEAGRALCAGKTDFFVPGLGNEDETGDIARAFVALKNKIVEAEKLRDALVAAKAEAERGRAATTEAEWLRRDLENMRAELARSQDAQSEVELLRKVIEATKEEIRPVESAATLSQATEDLLPQEPVQSTEPVAQETRTPLDTISDISRQVALSSQSVTQAAEEAERTGTLIRNLGDATTKIESVEEWLDDISEQADLLIVSTPRREPGDDGDDSNLVVLTPEFQSPEAPGGPGNDDAIGRRFDSIRKVAGQANWAIRDIAKSIEEAKEIALDIAKSSSAEALEVTTDLLEQSESLRTMLDKLVHRMQTQLFEEGDPSQPSDPEEHQV